MSRLGTALHLLLGLVPASLLYGLVLPSSDAGLVDDGVAVPALALSGIVGGVAAHNAWPQSRAPSSTPVDFLPPALPAAAQGDMRALQLPSKQHDVVWLLLRRLESASPAKGAP